MYNDHDRARLAVTQRDGMPAGFADQSIEDPKRPAFARDYDRIVHTTGFRRLQGKTQIVTPGQADFFRTRLTHTIEVAQIARRLAWRLCVEHGEAHAIQVADICEAAAAMHDLGHPPFGHIGEQALNDELDEISRDWGLDPLMVGGYEGNAQSFRQVTWSIRHDDSPGLQLTRGSLDASVKYPTTRTSVKQRKWNYYPSEQWAFEWIRKDQSSEQEKSFECQIMEWADDVAYSTHDMDDWYRAGYMPLALLTQSSEAREALASELAARWDRQGVSYEPDAVLGAVSDLFHKSSIFRAFQTVHGDYDGSGQAKRAIRAMRNELFALFLNEASVVGDAARGRHHAELHVASHLRLRSAVLKQMPWVYVIDHPRMATHQYGQKEVVRFLVRTYADAAISADRETLQTFPRAARVALENLRRSSDAAEKSAEVLRLVADHVGGMTDWYATMMYRRLTGSGDPFHQFT